jgi:hypothetical protein
VGSLSWFHHSFGVLCVSLLQALSCIGNPALSVLQIAVRSLEHLPMFDVLLGVRHFTCLLGGLLL